MGRSIILRKGDLVRNLLMEGRQASICLALEEGWTICGFWEPTENDGIYHILNEKGQPVRGDEALKACGFDPSETKD